MSASNVSQVVRNRVRTESYLQSLIPYPIDPIGSQNPIEFRLAPGEIRQVPVNFDAIGQFMMFYIHFQIANEYAGPQQAGTLAIAAKSNTFTGSGTHFTSVLQNGDVIWYINNSNQLSYAIVSQVVSDTVIKTSSAIPIAATSSLYGPMLSRNIPTTFGDDYGSDWAAETIMNTGTISLSISSSTMTGVGTKFLTQLVPGDKIEVFGNSGQIQYVIVNAITSDTSATIRGFAPLVSTSKPYTRFYTRYSDLEFNIFTAAGVWLGQSNVSYNQGAFGGATAIFQHKDMMHRVPEGLIRRTYLYDPSGGLNVQMRNTQADARRVHAHLIGLRIMS